MEVQTLDNIVGFDNYLSVFGKVLGRKANDSLAPLHIPGVHPLPDFSKYKRKPYPAQAHLIAAGAKTLRKRNALFMIGACGTGKTIMAMLAAHEHASKSRNEGGSNGKYRAIVICPNHLIKKWCRELSETIPGAIVRRFGNDGDDMPSDAPKQAWRDFQRMLDANVIRRMPGGFQHEVANGARWSKPEGAEWYVVGKNQIKFYPATRGMGKKGMKGFDGKEYEKKPIRHVVAAKTIKKDDLGRWVYDENGNPVYLKNIDKAPTCPKCGGIIKDSRDPVSWAMMHKKDARLYTCKSRYLEEIVAVDESGNRTMQGQGGKDRIYFDSSIAHEMGFSRYGDSKAGREIKVAGRKYIVKECNEKLWQYTNKPYRWPMAHTIQRKMRRFFKYLIVDEVHEQKDAMSIQSQAFGKVWSVTDKMMALTGTFINGYASSIYSLLMRMAPHELKARGFEWGDELEFVEEYGRVDTISTSKGPIECVRQTNTGRKVAFGKETIRREVAPGIMPTLFGHIVMPLAMFITLDELADELPNLTDVLDEGCVEMPCDIKAEYERVEATLARQIREMLFKGGMKLMGTMVQSLLAYPDHPYGWEPMFEEEHTIGYWEKPITNHPEMMTKENWRGVVSPHNFDLSNRVLPKEKKLVDICKRHCKDGSKVWVYVQTTRKHNVMPRLQKILGDAGFKCGVLNAEDVDPTDREDWVRENGAKYDVILSHPKLVSTGLDLFLRDRDDPALGVARYVFNYNVLTFFQTGYNLFDLRQAASRAWRLGQDWDCLVYYLYYGNTMQHRAMELMSRKYEAALQLEGSFSEEGLASLSSDSSAQMELCRSLRDKIDPNDIKRTWGKIHARSKRKERPDDETAAEDETVAEEVENPFDSEPAEMPSGKFIMTNSGGMEFACRIQSNPSWPQSYIQATPLGVTPAPPPTTLTLARLSQEGIRR